MQQIATTVFIAASLLFGVLGVIMALTGIDPGDGNSPFELIISRIFVACVFIILTSFALSVAGKYLKK